MRYGAKRDDVEPAIVKALELAGWTAVRLSDKGAPDLLAIRKGRCVPIECKSLGGTLTPAQETAFLRWLAAGLPVQVVRTPAEALLAVAQGVEGVLEPLEQRILRETGTVVTPAFQREQTAAVVPPKKKRRARRKRAEQQAQSVDFSDPPDRPNPED